MTRYRIALKRHCDCQDLTAQAEGPVLVSLLLEEAFPAPVRAQHVAPLPTARSIGARL